MNESDIGKVFLFSCPWDWTFVGRLIGFVGDRLIIGEAGYFTCTGATFDILCKDGFALTTRFHPSQTKGGILRIPNNGPVWEWEAPWPQPKRS